MNKYTPFLIVGGILGALYVFDRLTNINEGTPFEGTGPIGTLGNITDKASGGILSRFGSFLGGKAADLRDAITGINDEVTRTPGFPNGGAGSGGGGF